MKNETMNYKLPKPGEDDFYDINEYNRTMDLIDGDLMKLEEKKLEKNGDSSQTFTQFEEEVLRENLESGETLSLSHGKIKKWFSEMKDIAFSGRASDIDTDGAHRFVSDGEKNNWDSKVSATGDISGTKIQSLDSVSTEFPVPAEWETSGRFLGKVRKFIEDFNNFKTGIITVGKLMNNGNTTAGGYALDARYGKTLFDSYTKLKSDLSYFNINLTNALSIVDTTHFRLGEWTANGIERRGDTVHLHFHVELQHIISDWNEYKLFDLPTNYRTSHDFHGEKYTSYNGTNYLIQYFIRRNGTINLKVDTNAPVGVAISMDFTYFVN